MSVIRILLINSFEYFVVTYAAGFVFTYELNSSIVYLTIRFNVYTIGDLKNVPYEVAFSSNLQQYVFKPLDFISLHNFLNADVDSFAMSSSRLAGNVV